jgi:hypothetical protein
MATDATVAAPSRKLPGPGDYLRAVFDLGRRSIPPALPALVFLWFYNFGTGLYLEMARQGTSPLGFRDDRALLVHTLMRVSAYLPLLVLVYTPFLPLQDALLRGERRSFVSAIRQVLERMVPFVLSLILQLAIGFAPVALVAGILVAVIAPLPDLPREVVAVIAVAAIIPVVIWLLLSTYFMMFAIPGVVLSGQGPARSIRASVRLVGEHFWGFLVRLVVFLVVLVAVVMVASIPTMVVGAVAAGVTRTESVFRIGIVLWSSLIQALTFPFWVAAVLVFYRAVVPAGEGAAEAVPGIESGVLAGALRHPGEHPTPFQFE